MKKILLIPIFFFAALTGIAQKTVVSTERPANIQAPVEAAASDNDYKIYSVVDVPASFPGGDSAWKLFLNTNLNIAKIKDSIKLPERKTTFSETVLVKFVVAKDGAISDIRAVNNDANKNCIEEAIRIIKKSRKWVPAQLNGKLVNAYCIQPVNFSFSN